MKIIISAVAAAALVVPSLATANDITVQGREAVSVTVSSADLNLSTVEGLQTLRSRMAKAIAATCNPGDRIGADMSPDFKCRQEMSAKGETQILQLAQRNAILGRVASN